DELDLMAVLLRRCMRERKPYLLTVVAPPGIGKTRLVTEFAERVRAMSSDNAVVRGRCLAYGEGLRFWPLSEILKEDAGILDSDPAAGMLAKVRERIDGRFGDPGTRSNVTLTLLSSIGVMVDPDPLEGVGRSAA